jgi:hypothetical protein
MSRVATLCKTFDASHNVAYNPHHMSKHLSAANAVWALKDETGTVLEVSLVRAHLVDVATNRNLPETNIIPMSQKWAKRLPMRNHTDLRHWNTHPGHHKAP